jgi:uncharacterized protein YndB with AHSA1/START domain
VSLEHSLERTVFIAAARSTVFRFFTDSARFAAWWGAGSTIDPRPGGAVHIRYPNGVMASGEVKEVEPDRRIVFTYGYEGEGKPFAPGGSLVTITLAQEARGTRLHLLHELPTAATRDEHVQGWRYQLAVFANVAAADQHTDLDARVDAFLGAWSETDAPARRARLAGVADESLVFHDRFSCTAGLEDLAAHIGAAQVHMPGLRLEREGAVRQCQGVALADWVARGPDGAVRGRGVNVIELAADGRLSRVTGFWSA